jgi:microcompartment protein CcmL/EutN
VTKACGFLECEGFVPIFHAVDAMTKSTEVTVSGVIKLGGGLVAVSVTGDLATVEEAIAIGEAVIEEGAGKPRHRSIIFANPCAPVAALASNPKILASA